MTKQHIITYKSNLIDTPPSALSCPTNIFSCRLQNAQAVQTQKERVAECFAIPKSIWQNECFFEVAESGIQKNTLSYHHAAELCSLSEQFVFNCLQHISIILAEKSTSLSMFPSSANAIQSFWQEKDASISVILQEIYWMTSMELYYSKKVRMSNEAFLTLPSKAHPHIWASIAQEIVKRSRKKKSLAEWSGVLKKLYDGEQTITLSKKSHGHHKRPTIPKPSKSTSFPRVLFFGEHKRILGENLEEEILIALVSAAKKYNKYPEWIEEAKKSSSERIQESAKN